MGIKQHLPTDFLPNRLIMAFLMGGVFSFIGWVSPTLYYSYFDTTDYLEVRQPIEVVGDVYQPCDTLTIIANRRASITLPARLNVEILSASGIEESRQIHTTEIIFESTDGEYKPLRVSEWKLPCDTTDGKWLIQGVLTYDLHNVERSYAFLSEIFEVRKDLQNEDTVIESN